MIERGFSLKGSYSRYQKKEIRDLCSQLSEEKKREVSELIRARAFLYPEHGKLAKFTVKVLNGR